MVPCSSAEHGAVATVGCGIGIHLTLNSAGTDGLLAVHGESTATDTSGVLLPQPADTWQVSTPEDVKAECAAQVDRAISWGVDPTHVDSHMGTVLLDERFASATVRLAREMRRAPAHDRSTRDPSSTRAERTAAADCPAEDWQTTSASSLPTTWCSARSAQDGQDQSRAARVEARGDRGLPAPGRRCTGGSPIWRTSKSATTTSGSSPRGRHSPISSTKSARR